MPWSLDADFPAGFSEVLDSLNFVLLDVFVYLPFDCVSSVDMFDKLLLKTVAPVVLSVALMMAELPLAALGKDKWVDHLQTAAFFIL